MDNQNQDGLISDWLENNTIKRFKLIRVRNEALTWWAEQSVVLLESHTSPGPFLLVHDISSQAVGLLISMRSQFDVMHPAVTIGGQARINEILLSRPDFKVRLAVIVSQAMSAQFVRRRATGSVPILPNLSVKVFFNIEAALDWLKAPSGTQSATEQSDVEAVS